MWPWLPQATGNTAEGQIMFLAYDSLNTAYLLLMVYSFFSLEKENALIEDYIMLASIIIVSPYMEWD